jgi:hypothetical protein
VEKGRVIHTMGFPLPAETFGGGFIYAMPGVNPGLGLDMTGGAIAAEHRCEDPRISVSTIEPLETLASRRVQVSGALLRDVLYAFNWQPSELEPILAHELIHVRRGDLWLGFLQLLASSLWWFHPLVRLAMQRAMAEAERCCDEAVIALLRCDPASYARCLIDVLAKKQELMAAPAFPGVRPLDVTVTRLERIMKLGHGCRTRTPWWCWVVMGTAALVTLPGAAFVLKAQEQPQPSAVPMPAERTRAVGSPTPIREYEPELTYVVVYQIDDIVEKVKNDLGCEEQICREIILKKLRNENGIVRSSPAIHRQLEADGNRVVVQDTTIGHKRLNEVVEGLRKYGFRQVMFQIWLFQGPSEEFARIHSALSEADQSHNQVRLLQVEPSAIAKKIEANAALKTISRPQVVVEDSEQAQLSIGVENGEEVSLALQPFVKGEKEIQLVVTLGNSNVSENELVIPATVNSPEQKIKPRYRRELQADIRMNTNEVLAIESAPVPTGDGNEAILAVVKAHILTGEDLSESKLGLKLETAPDGASSEGKIPYLGDIPYVGRLFKR